MPTRKVIIAFGCQVRDWRTNRDVVDLLNAEATSTGTDAWAFKKGELEVQISLVYTKDGFRAALDDEDAIVVYDGHSRIGQGPAFSDANITDCPDSTAYPTNPWDDSFRMGYDAVLIECIEDIMHHCTNPKEHSGTMPKDFFAKPFLVQVLTKAAGRSTKCDQRTYAKRPLSTCFPAVAAQKNGRGVESLSSRHYWYTTREEKDYITVVTVGSSDLDGVSLKCAVLFMNSCSSRGHFLKALRRRKAKIKSKCMFYMTGESCSASTSVIFLRLILDGWNVLSKKGSKKVLKTMNGESDAGAIGLYR